MVSTFVVVKISIYSKHFNLDLTGSWLKLHSLETAGFEAKFLLSLTWLLSNSMFCGKILASNCQVFQLVSKRECYFFSDSSLTRTLDSNQNKHIKLKQ